jgi:hypothetical protein
MIQKLAERVGFEPTLEFPLNTLSKRAPSATRPSLRRESWKEMPRISVKNAAANSADPLHINSIGASSKRQLGREKKSGLKWVPLAQLGAQKN